jgi:hypothetical protein
MNIEIIDHILHINGKAMMTIPETGREASVSIWSVPEEYREKGIFVSVTENGAVEEVPACATGSYRLLKQIAIEPSGNARLRHRKRELITQLSQSCDEEIAKLASQYPEHEVSSWPQQVKEAERILADPTQPAPLLSAISSARGVELSDLAARVVLKMEAYAAAAGEIIGRRQSLEDQVERATTVEELELLQW